MDDREGFAAFYDAHRRELHAAVTVTLGDADLAREAVDEALVRAAERWTQVRTLDRPTGWVYRTAVNWAWSWHRKWRRRPTRPLEELDRATHDALPDLDLRARLASLPLQQRQIVVLRHALQFSVTETAAVLGIAEGTVKSGLHRARQRLLADKEALDGTA